MVDTAKLRGILAEHNESQAKAAKAIGVTPNTFYRKMKSGVFGSDEISIMIKRYNIKDPMSIFFKSE